MGLDIRTAEFLLYCRKLGVDFSTTCTLGRQTVMLSPFESTRLSRWLGGVETKGHEYAEFFFCALGASQLDAMDASAYEGATILHNLNCAVPPELQNRFSCLIDGGTLEHIFDFKEALKNCMQMVQPGGHLILCQMANNLMGHGFYQFSPELFYAALTPENGYEIKVVVLHSENAWHEPYPPAQIGDRVQAMSTGETYIYVLARKVSDVVPFLRPPHQADYVSNLTITHPSVCEETSPTAPVFGLYKKLINFLRHLKRNYLIPNFPLLAEWDLRRSRNLYLKSCRLTNRKKFRYLGKSLPF